MNKVKELLKSKSSVTINLGSSDATKPQWINVDIRPFPGVDVVCDLEKYPWPFPSGCADLLIASQLVEHIDPHGGNFMRFMDEAWRVTKLHGQFMISTPYAGSTGYYQDPSHINPCNEVTWSYFDPTDKFSNGLLYTNYHPMPWKIIENSWYSNGNMEVILEKIPDDPSYHPYGKELKFY